MPTAVITAITAFFEIMCGQNHQTVFKIIVEIFDEYVFLFRLFFILFHTKQEIPCYLPHRESVNQSTLCFSIRYFRQTR